MILPIRQGYYDSCDAGMVDDEGNVFIGGRLDDVINVAGHRLSTKQMELCMASHGDVMEQAVIGIHDPVKGIQPVGLVVLNKGGFVYYLLPFPRLLPDPETFFETRKRFSRPRNVF